MASLADFQQIDLRIATVKSAELHPNADRLLVLKIDVGGEERQIVVVFNLEPAKLRGVESQGMLLAARDGDRVVVLTPEAPVVSGSKVS